MKKILLLVLLQAAVLFSFGQTFNYTVTAGVNASTFNTSFNKHAQGILTAGEKINSSLVAGYQLGVYTEFAFEHMSIQPGLLFSSQGGIHNNTDDINAYTYIYSNKATFRLYYIKLPVHALYYLPTKKYKVFFGVGPYIAMGVAGHYSAFENSLYNGVHTTATINGTVSFGHEDDQRQTYSNITYIKNPDYGVSLLAGINLRHNLKLSAGYDIGVANLSTDYFTSSRNNVFDLSVGYTFDSK